VLHVEKQRQRAEQVVVVYEAGPLGYTLYRKLKAAGVLCCVCAPDSAEQQRKRRKNNKIDARNSTSKLFNYLNGDQEALQLARVPSEAQEQLRMGQPFALSPTRKNFLNTVTTCVLRGKRVPDVPCRPRLRSIRAAFFRAFGAHANLLSCG
jgi:hypothetical protein